MFLSILPAISTAFLIFAPADAHAGRSGHVTEQLQPRLDMAISEGDLAGAAQLRKELLLDASRFSPSKGEELSGITPADMPRVWIPANRE